MGGFFKRIFKIEPEITLGQWAYDRITNNWIWIVSIIGGGGLSYLATITAWIKPWGPVGYGAVGLATALVIYLILSFGYSFIGRARERSAQADYIRSRARQSTVNVLAPVHSHEKIELSQFFNHFYLPTENVRFEDCNLIGPFMLGG